MVRNLESPASILITAGISSSPGESVCSTAGLDGSLCLLFRTVFLRPLTPGVSVAGLKMSLNVAREHLMDFGADNGFTLRRGAGAPSGGIGEIDTLPSWGVFSPGDLICLACFRFSLRGLTSCFRGCEEPLSTSSDDPVTIHQLLGGRLLRFPGSSGAGFSTDFFEEAAAGLLGFFSLVTCWCAF